MSFDGRISGIRFSAATGWTAEGWAFDRRDPAVRPTVEIADSLGPLVRGIAAMPSPPYTNGLGHGFALPLPETWSPKEDPVSLRLAVSIGGRTGRFENTAPVQPVFGWIDAPRGVVVDGWAASWLTLSEPLTLDLLLDGQLADRVVADRFRDDLAPLGLSTHGFRWILPEAFLDGRPRRLAIRPTNGSRLVPCPPVIVGLARHRLSGAARKAFHQRRAALAHCSGLGLARPIEPPSAAASRLMGATQLALQRFISPVWPDPSQDPAVSARQVYLSFEDRATLGLADGPLGGGVFAVRDGLLLGHLDLPGDGEILIDCLVNDQPFDRVLAVRRDGSATRTFAALLPPFCFDGRPQDFAARIANSRTLLPECCIGLQLPPTKANPTSAQLWRTREVGRRRLRTADDALLAMPGYPPDRTGLSLILQNGSETVWSAPRSSSEPPGFPPKVAGAPVSPRIPGSIP